MVDVRKHRPYPLTVSEKQEEKESRRLWAKLTEAVKTNNMDMATKEKTKVEDQERALRKERQDMKIEWTSRFFIPKNDSYALKDVEE